MKREKYKLKKTKNKTKKSKKTQDGRNIYIFNARTKRFQLWLTFYQVEFMKWQRFVSKSDFWSTTDRKGAWSKLLMHVHLVSICLLHR